jgi:hypothetical protein
MQLTAQASEDEEEGCVNVVKCEGTEDSADGWRIVLGLIGRFRWGPLGAQPVFLKPNLVGAYPDTWLNLLESRVWRGGTPVHACSKHVARAGGL